MGLKIILSEWLPHLSEDSELIMLMLLFSEIAQAPKYSFDKQVMKDDKKTKRSLAR